MKAFVIDKYGEGAEIRTADIPTPTVGGRDVLVRIRAAGVNPLDSKIKAGEFKIPLPYKLPLVLGNDLAGVVEQTGPEVTRFAVGDQVYARPDKDRIGTFAEAIAVSEDDLAPKPRSLTMADAASLPLVALTAWQALVELASLSPGQKVLIHAGTGGIGTIAIQLAKYLGAHVATTVSAANTDFVRDLGADEVVDYRTQDFTAVISDYDVVLDPLGPDNVLKSLSVVRPGGLVIGLGGPPDPAFATYLGRPLLRPVLAIVSRKVRARAKRLGVHYKFLCMRADGDHLASITELVEAGAIRPTIDRTFPFADTVAALDYVDTGRARGKVVVVMTEEHT